MLLGCILQHRIYVLERHMYLSIAGKVKKCFQVKQFQTLSSNYPCTQPWHFHHLRGTGREVSHALSCVVNEVQTLPVPSSRVPVSIACTSTLREARRKEHHLKTSDVVLESRGCGARWVFLAGRSSSVCATEMWWWSEACGGERAFMPRYRTTDRNHQDPGVRLLCAQVLQLLSNLLWRSTTS